MRRQFSFVSLLSCSVPREKKKNVFVSYFEHWLYKILNRSDNRTCCFKSRTSLISECYLFIYLFFFFFNFENHDFLADTCIISCHITLKVPWFSRAVHTTVFSFRTLCCTVFRGSDHGKSIIYLILPSQYSCSSLQQLRFE